MFLKHEKSEMDDFERKQNLVLNVNTYKNFNSLRIYGVKVFNGYPCKHFNAKMVLFEEVCIKGTSFMKHPVCIVCGCIESGGLRLTEVS